MASHKLHPALRRQSQMVSQLAAKYRKQGKTVTAPALAKEAASLIKKSAKKSAKKSQKKSHKRSHRK